MPRKENEAVPEGNGPIPQQKELESGQPTLADVYQMIGELFDKSDRRLEKLSDEMRRIDQRLASLDRDAPQPRLAMKADVPANKKTRERTEGAVSFNASTTQGRAAVLENSTVHSLVDACVDVRACLIGK